MLVPSSLQKHPFALALSQKPGNELLEKESLKKLDKTQKSSNFDGDCGCFLATNMFVPFSLSFFFFFFSTVEGDCGLGLSKSGPLFLCSQKTFSYK